MIGYLRTLLLFYKRHLRVQPLRELMAVLGVAAGVALLFAVQVAHHSITGSFEEIAHGVAGRATLEVAARGPEGFSERSAEEVERMPGVRAAAPIIAQPIVAIGPSGRRTLTLVGATEEVSRLHGRISSAFERAGAKARKGFLLLTAPVARAIGAKVGGRITVLIDGRTERMALGAVVGEGAIGAAAQSPIAAAPLAIVQAASGLQGRVSRVLVEPQPGREAALRRALSRRFGATLDPRPTDTEAGLLADAASSESQVTLLFSVISLVAGIILAYNALLLASEERRKFIVYLIETGTPDSMVLSSLAFDALILGLAGCLIGLLAGEAISLLAYRGVPGYLAAAFPVSSEHVVSAQTVAIAVGGGLLAAFAAAILPAVAILRGSAIAQPEAVGRTLSLTGRLRPSDRGLFALGLALICASVLAALLAPASTVVALVGLAAGIVICLPTIARGLLAMARAASRRVSDPAARLSVAELRGAPTRPVALLATGAIAAFLMIVIGGSVGDVQSAVRSGAGNLLSGASLWIRSAGAENVYTTQPFSYTNAQRRLQRLPMVTSVKAWRDSFLDLPGGSGALSGANASRVRGSDSGASGRRVWVLGVPRSQRNQIVPSQLIEGSLAQADARIREGGWAALSETIAAEEHLHVGQRFTLPTPSGIAHLRLAATTANYGWLSGAVVMNAAEHARLWRSDGATELAVRLKPGVPVDRARRAVQAALADEGSAGSSTGASTTHSALTVQTTAQRRAEVSAVLGSTLARLSDTTIVVIVTAIASVIALMIAAVWQSRGRLESLMAIGMDFRQVARLIFYESGVALLSGCLLGVAFGLLGQYLIDGWLQHTTGSPVQFSPAWQLALRTVAIVVGVSLIASLIATLRATASQPRAALSTE